MNWLTTIHKNILMLNKNGFILNSIPRILRMRRLFLWEMRPWNTIKGWMLYILVSVFDETPELRT